MKEKKSKSQRMAELGVMAEFGGNKSPITARLYPEYNKYGVRWNILFNGAGSSRADVRWDMIYFHQFVKAIRNGTVFSLPAIEDIALRQIVVDGITVPAFIYKENAIVPVPMVEINELADIAEETEILFDDATAPIHGFRRYRAKEILLHSGCVIEESVETSAKSVASGTEQSESAVPPELNPRVSLKDMPTAAAEEISQPEETEVKAENKSEEASENKEVATSEAYVEAYVDDKNAESSDMKADKAGTSEVAEPVETKESEVKEAEAKAEAKTETKAEAKAEVEAETSKDSVKAEKDKIPGGRAHTEKFTTLSTATRYKYLDSPAACLTATAGDKKVNCVFTPDCVTNNKDFMNGLALKKGTTFKGACVNGKNVKGFDIVYIKSIE